MHIKPLLPRLILLPLLALLIAACSGTPAGVVDSNLETAPVKGALAPDFTLETTNGETISLSDFRGKAVLINFWATWCGPCRTEMPFIQSRFERYAPDLVVLAVDYDEPKDLVVEFVEELGLTFTVLLDPGGLIQNVYLVRGYPSSFFVDANGVIQAVHIGVMAESQLDEYLAQVGLGG